MAKKLWANTASGANLQFFNLDSETIQVPCSDVLRVVKENNIDMKISLDPFNSFIYESFTISDSNTFVLTRNLSEAIQDMLPLEYDKEEEVYIGDSEVEYEHSEIGVLGFIRKTPIKPIEIRDNGDAFEVEFEDVIGRWPDEEIIIGYIPEPEFFHDGNEDENVAYYDPAPTALEFSGSGKIWIVS